MDMPWRFTCAAAGCLVLAFVLVLLPAWMPTIDAGFALGAALICCQAMVALLREGVLTMQAIALRLER